MKTKGPLVSVIIPAFNEEKVIGRLLDSLKKQSYRKIEIIVVDDASIDSTAIVAKKYTRKVYSRPHGERSVQRNFGAKKAKGSYFLFLDSDMELSRDVVNDCIDRITSNKEIGGIVIPEISVASNYWEKVKAFERSFYNKSGDCTTDAARFFSKYVFWKVGGYDVNITGPEDWDLPEMIRSEGFRIDRIKSKIFHYERVPNPIKLAQKKFYYGLKASVYMKKHNISPVGAKTIYFLRPVFYKNWRELVSHPFLSISMVLMLSLEQLGGGMGYLVGLLKK